MVNENKKIIEESLRKLNSYFEEFFSNIYNYYEKGTGYNISKYQKKTKYRFRNTMKIIKNILEREKEEQIRQKFLEFYELLERKKEKESLRNTDWLQAEIIINACFVQNTCILEIIKQMLEKQLDIEKIEKKVMGELSELRWDYEKTLGKKFPNKEFISLEKAITCRKRKKK